MTDVSACHLLFLIVFKRMIKPKPMNSRKKHYSGTETTNITYMKNLFVRVRRAFKNRNLKPQIM